MPPGVINFLPGSGSMIGRVTMGNRNFAGVHFTGSNGTFNQLWRNVAANLETYKTYPRIVGETGGKGFVFAHPSANAAGSGHGARPRRVRVPGPEVLGRQPGLHPAFVVAGGQERRARHDRDHQGRRRARLLATS